MLVSICFSMKFYLAPGIGFTLRYLGILGNRGIEVSWYLGREEFLAEREWGWKDEVFITSLQTHFVPEVQSTHTHAVNHFTI